MALSGDGAYCACTGTCDYWFSLVLVLTLTVHAPSLLGTYNYEVAHLTSTWTHHLIMRGRKTSLCVGIICERCLFILV